MQTLELQEKNQKIENTQNIVYCEAIGEFTKLFFNDGDWELIPKSMYVVEKSLPQNKFFKIHDRYIINVDYLKKIKLNNGRLAILRKDCKLLISLEKYSELIDFLRFQYKI